MTDVETQNKTVTPEPAKTALGASLTADYEALQNDLEQAQELAADFQRQLAGKSNEVAHFKNVLQRTQEDFNRLEGHIEELRRERHRLANEVMRVMALDAHIHKLKTENERLREQLETLNNASSTRVEELLIVSDDQQKEIKRLRAVVEVLRKREGIPPILTTIDATEAQQQISELQETVKRLEARLNQTAPPNGRGRLKADEIDLDVINLSFEH